VKGVREIVKGAQEIVKGAHEIVKVAIVVGATALLANVGIVPIVGLAMPASSLVALVQMLEPP
jgi:hypothetical protein